MRRWPRISPRRGVAEADPHEFAAHRAGDRLAERGLADAGGRRSTGSASCRGGRVIARPGYSTMRRLIFSACSGPRRVMRRASVMSDRVSSAGSRADRAANRDRCVPSVFGRRFRHRCRRRLLARLVLDLLWHIGLGVASVSSPCPRPCRRRPRRAGAGSPPSARRSSTSRWRSSRAPWSAGRSRAELRDFDAVCEYARDLLHPGSRCRWSRGFPASARRRRPDVRRLSRSASAAGAVAAWIAAISVGGCLRVAR